MRFASLVCVAALLLAFGSARAESLKDVADLIVKFDPPQAKPGQLVTLRFTLAPKKGAYTYPVTKSDAGGKSVIGFGVRGDVVLVGDVKNPRGAVPKNPDAGEFDEVYKAPVTWEVSAVVSPTATPGAKTIVLANTRLQACTTGIAENCYNLRDPQAELEVLAGPAVPLPEAYKGEVEKALAASAPPVRATPPTAAPAPASVATVESTHAGAKKTAISAEEYGAALDALKAKLTTTPTVGTKSVGPDKSSDLPSLLAAAWVWGWISLVTPCVFPMIPITISLFLKQSHQTGRQVVKLAGIYCLTIIVVLGASAVFLLSVFRALSVDPYMNVFLGGLFVFFALSLFGMYDIQLPGFLLRYTEKRRGAGGTVGTVFGALAFSIVSFTCVAPFLGGFAGMAAAGNFSTAELVLAGVVFATAFASPFFVFALFPSLLKKLPKSGGWMDTVKAVMGFLELAAAFKFFRTAEIGLLAEPTYFTYDLVMAAWVAIAGAAGLYLLNLYRLPHDDEQSNIPVPRLLFGLAFMGLAVYLAPAMWKSANGTGQRPNGVVFAWVDAFLLPDATEEWSADLPGALDLARKEKAAGKTAKTRIFVDFTGETCTNCRYNENNVFTKREVRELLDKYALVQMYTDWVPATMYAQPPSDADRAAEAAHNVAFQQAVFGTVQLPLYAILEPQVSGGVRIVGVYEEGKINDVPGFVKFLTDGLK